MLKNLGDNLYRKNLSNCSQLIMNEVLRFKSVIAYIVKCGIASNQKDLGLKMGYSNESSFSQVVNGKVPMPKDFIERLKSFVPDLNSDWLLTGEGDMLKSGIERSVKDGSGNEDIEIEHVRLLPLFAHGGSLSDFTVSVKDSDCEKVVSPVKGADFAIQVTGDSMAPEYPSGSVILIKKINESAFIEWGKAYVLDTENGSVVKKVVPSDKEGCIRCVSINPDPSFAPFDVPLSSVFGIYRVLMCMSMK